MDVTSEEAQKLLDRVVEATERAQRSREVADHDSTLRREAVEAAMEAGLPRDQIAAAAGVHRNVLYQIVKQDARRK
ncbi:hypothetical protein ACFRAQ_35640 [Nocardia sp. NPDC056611]|uniref:hypothetical protein n=1 Tax=Nocardia sp. NPDC056611 TaxID=3345877 RepID=UPI00366ECBE0